MIKNEDIIIQLAKNAGLESVLGSWCQECGCTDEALLKFAEMVAATEREACAEVCENLYYGMRFQPTRSECADAIRTRGKK